MSGRCPFVPGAGKLFDQPGMSPFSTNYGAVSTNYGAVSRISSNQIRSQGPLLTTSTVYEGCLTYLTMQPGLQTYLTIQRENLRKLVLAAAQHPAQGFPTGQLHLCRCRDGRWEWKNKRSQLQPPLCEIASVLEPPRPLSLILPAQSAVLFPAG